MITLSHVSGVDLPSNGISHIYMNASGVLSVRRPDGTVVSSEPGSIRLSGLVDVNAAFTSGQLLNYSTSSFVPGASTPGAANTLTIVSSGQMAVMALLYSGVIPTGGNPQTFTFNNIDQSYTDLEIRGMIRASAATTTVGVACYFNGDTTATHYRSRYLQGAGAGGIGTPTHVATSDSLCAVAHAASYNDTSNGSVTPFHIWIPNYSTPTTSGWPSKGARKVTYNIGGQLYWNSTQVVYIDMTSSWVIAGLDFPPITSIDLRCINATTSFAAGTEFYVYGHKKVWVITSGIYGTAGIVNGKFV